MDALKQWALCLIVSAAAGTLLTLLSPRGSSEKTLKTVVGIFMIAAVCTPLSELKGTDFEMPAYAELDGIDSSIDFEERYVETFRSVIDAQVKTAAEECSIASYEVFADISLDDDSCIIIHEIAVEAAEENKTKLNAFSSLLQQRLGVSVSVTGKQEGTNFENG